MLQTVQEEKPVGKPAESVVKRIVLRLLLSLFSICDITIHDDQLGDIAFLVPDRARYGLQNAPTAILVADAILPFSADSRAASFLRCFEHAKAIVRMDLFKRRSSAKFRGRIAQDSLVCGTVVEAASLHIDQSNHVGGIFCDDLKQLFALLRLPMDLVDADLLVDCDDYQRSEGEPFPIHSCTRESRASPEARRPAIS